MGDIVLGLASSHAFALMEPSDWDEYRLLNRRGYEQRYGVFPPENERIAQETPELVEEGYGRIRGSFGTFRTAISEAKPDALILIADDQNEIFTAVIPQLAIYTGEDFLDDRIGHEATERRNHVGLAKTILRTAVEHDIEMVNIAAFPENRLFAHAFGPVLRAIDPTAQLPVVPIFINSIHEPAPSPERCYRFGQVIQDAIRRHGEGARVAIYASGGLSHFTAGYPWPFYDGPFSHGDIDEHFDRRVLAEIAAGRGSQLAKLTSADLLAHGEIELRSWIVALGALGDIKPSLLEYAPLFRAIMGMGVAAWPAPVSTAI